MTRTSAACWLATLCVALSFSLAIESGGEAMEAFAEIAVPCFFILVIAWKIFKGLLGLAIGLAVVGLVIYGGAKLLGGGTKRIK